MRYVKLIVFIILTSAFAMGSISNANETDQNKAIFEVA